jgi:hypothetical protein
MTALAAQRCDHHARREAVARCPACSRYFCRECVTEHAGRVLCTTCLHKLLRVPDSPRQGWRWGVRCLCCMVSFAMLWLLFYWLAQTLLTLPDTFHQGTLWYDRPGEQQ